MGGRWEGNSKEGTYVHLWLIYADVWQKSNQYCKPVINQLKTNKYFKKYSVWHNVTCLLEQWKLADYWKSSWIVISWWIESQNSQKHFKIVIISLFKLKSILEKHAPII